MTTMEPNEIRKTREKFGMTQVEFGVLVGVRVETIHRWEVGKYKPLPAFEKRIRELAKNGKGEAA